MRKDQTSLPENENDHIQIRAAVAVEVVVVVAEKNERKQFRNTSEDKKN